MVGLWSGNICVVGLACTLVSAYVESSTCSMPTSSGSSRAGCGKAIGPPQVSTKDDCCQLCAGDGTCTHWDWNSKTESCQTWSGESHCSVKKDSHTSGAKISQCKMHVDKGTSRAGCGTKIGLPRTCSWEECCDLCSAAASCTHWVWSTKTRSCIIYSGEMHCAVASQSSTSGAKLSQCTMQVNQGASRQRCGTAVGAASTCYQEDCCDLCTSSGTCTHWDWNVKTHACHIYAGESHCSVKSTNSISGAKIPTCGTKTAMQVSTHNSRVGCGTSIGVPSTASESDCCDLCSDNTACTHWDWHAKLQSCMMYTGDSHCSVHKQDVTSGAKMLQCAMTLSANLSRSGCGTVMANRTCSQIDCCDLCTSDKRCTHWEFDSQASLCYLYSGESRCAVKRPNWISGAAAVKCGMHLSSTSRSRCGTAIPGVTTSSQSDCCDRCSASASCTHFDWHSKTLACQMYSGESHCAVESSNTISGAKMPQCTMYVAQSTSRAGCGSTIGIPRTCSEAECCDLCKLTATCTHWDWDSVLESCVLYSGDSYCAAEKQHSTSGAKISKCSMPFSKTTSRAGCGSRLGDIRICSQNDCCEMCTSDKTCTHWNWLEQKRECSLYTGDFHCSSEKQNSVSGAKMPKCGMDTSLSTSRASCGTRIGSARNCSQAECCDLCLLDATCSHWDWKKDRHSCSIYSGETHCSVSSTNHVSGTKQAMKCLTTADKGITRATCGSLIGKPVTCSQQECCDLCSADAKCTHWDWDTGKSSCRIYSGESHCSLRSPKMVSGTYLSPVPPPAPPSPQTWPTFNNAAALQGDPWGKYFKLVYGEIPSSGYPIATIDLWVLYDVLLAKSGVAAPPIVGNCPTKASQVGQRYTTNNMFSPPSTSWIWHPYPYQAILSSTWVEVIHQKDPFGDEHFGAWLMYAKGSGIWFNMGKTITFPEHGDAFSHFGVAHGNLNEEMSKAAAAKGYDSVQFSAHRDPVEYQRCDTQHTGQQGLAYMNLEIVGVKLVGEYPCGAAAEAPPVIRCGWLGTRPCKCAPDKDFLNCQEVLIGPADEALDALVI